MRVVICILIVLFTVTSIHAATIHVPADQATIQAGINASVNGDTVLVAPGVYAGPINFNGKLIAVKSSGGPLLTKVTASESVNVVQFDHGETSSAVLEGFSIEGGRIGVACFSSAPTIMHNVLAWQNFTGWAALVLAGNETANIGPAGATIVNNTIVHSANGGISSFSSVSPIVKNNIIAHNHAYGVHQDGAAAPISLTYNDLYDNPSGDYYECVGGIGSITQDPVLNLDFTLATNSPCINAGDPSSAYNDPDGTRNDIGALYHAPRTLHVPSEYSTIQMAIDSSLDGDTVLVAPGAYTGNGNQNIQIIDKSITVRSEKGPDSTFIVSDPGTSGFNITSNGIQMTVKVAGLSIRDASRGVSCESEWFHDITIEDCRFINCGVCMYSAATGDNSINIAISHSILDSSAIGVQAAYNYWSVPAYKINNCLFRSNGTAILCPDYRWMAASIDSSTFIENDISVSGGAYISNSSISGGRIGLINGVASEYTPNNTEVSNCIIKGIRESVFNAHGNMSIVNTTIQDNSGRIGVSTHRCREDCSGLYFLNCRLERNDGGILANGRISLTSCDYISNRLGIVSGYGYFGDVNNCTFAYNDSACLILSDRSQFTVQNCNFLQNGSDAIRITGTSMSQVPSIERSIIANNGGYGVLIDIAQYLNPSVICSDIFGNSVGNYFGIPDQTGINGNISADPLFCNTTSGDFHIRDVSPCAPAHNSCGQLIGALGVECSGVPAVNGLAVKGEAITNIRNHLPQYEWQFSSPIPASQTQFEIAVGTDTNWNSAEMWDPGTIASPDTFVTYSGSPLIDGQTYYLRLQVHNGYAWSPWYQTSFRMNSVPSVPGIVRPSNDQLAPNLPMLVITDGSDAENDPISYDFEVYGDSALTQLEWQGLNIPEFTGTDTTVYQVGTLLTENARHWWRVRSYDGYEYSDWSASARFWMNANEEAPWPFGLTWPPDSLGMPVFNMLPTLRWMTSVDPDPLDTVRYKVELSLNSIFQGSVGYDSIYSITFQLPDSLEFGTRYWWRARAYDKTGLTIPALTARSFWTWALGDINHSHICDLSDLSGMVSYLTGGGYVISPKLVGDLNGSCFVDLTDLSIMVSYLTGGGAVLKVGCE